MMINNPLLDEVFLQELYATNQQETYAKIIALNWNEEPLQELYGVVTQGSANVDGDSAVRRTCSLSFVVKDQQITDYYWGMEKKFKLYSGLKNIINPEYPDIIWFPLGLYVCTSYSKSEATNSFSITIQGKDKMCLLNGEIGGAITASSVDFGTTDIYNEEQEITVNKKLKVKDIIRESVHEYAKEPFHNIIIKDLDMAGKELLEYRGKEPLYIFFSVESQQEVVNITTNPETKCILVGDNREVTVSDPDIIYDVRVSRLREEFNEPTLVLVGDTQCTITKLEYGDTAGYRNTELIYSGDLIANVGENICTSVLDKIVSMLGEYEYFYNLDGQFVFQKKQIYIDTTWTPIQGAYVENNTYETSYSYDLKDVISINSNPNIANVRNDFSIWGTRPSVSGAELPVHLRFAIDRKPVQYKAYNGNTYIAADKFKISADNKIHCDWRELIYQMAVDYLQHYHEDSFRATIAKNNPEQYPTGYTGYEQYYTDIQGFWRELYNPYQEWLPGDIIIDDSTFEPDIDRGINLLVPLEGNSPKDQIYLKDNSLERIETEEVENIPITNLALNNWDSNMKTIEYNTNGIQQLIFTVDSCVGHNEVARQLLDKYSHDATPAETIQVEAMSKVKINVTQENSKGNIIKSEQRIIAYYPGDNRTTEIEIVKDTTKIKVIIGTGLNGNDYIDTNPDYPNFKPGDWGAASSYFVASVNIQKHFGGSSSEIYKKLDPYDLLWEFYNNYENFYCDFYYKPSDSNIFALLLDSISHGVAISFDKKYYFKEGTFSTRINTDMGGYITGSVYIIDANGNKTQVNGIISDGIHDSLLDKNEVYQCEITDSQNYNLYLRTSKYINKEKFISFLKDNNIQPQDIFINYYNEQGLMEGININTLITLSDNLYYFDTKNWNVANSIIKEYYIADYDNAGCWMGSFTMLDSRPQYAKQDTIDQYQWKDRDNQYYGWNRQVTENPSSLNFWFDFLDNGGETQKFSTYLIGDRPKAVNDNNVKSIYFKDTPNIVFKLPDTEIDNETGYIIIQITQEQEEMFTISSEGKSAKDVLDSFLYNYTYAVDNTTFSCIPIYTLQPNTRIKYKDDNYIVSKITIPLSYNGTMSITASKIAESIL